MSKLLYYIDAPLVDENCIRQLNLYYAKALIYEFSLNSRDSVFVNKVIKVIFIFFKFILLDYYFEYLHHAFMITIFRVNLKNHHHHHFQFPFRS